MYVFICLIVCIYMYLYASICIYIICMYSCIYIKCSIAKQVAKWHREIQRVRYVFRLLSEFIRKLTTHTLLPFRSSSFQYPATTKSSRPSFSPFAILTLNFRGRRRAFRAILHLYNL